MKKLPQQYLCTRCDYITTRVVEKCPACGDGENRKWSLDGPSEEPFGKGTGDTRKKDGAPGNAPASVPGSSDDVSKDGIGWYISDTHARRAIGYLTTIVGVLNDYPVPDLASAWGEALEKTMDVNEMSPIGPEAEVPSQGDEAARREAIIAEDHAERDDNDKLVHDLMDQADGI